MPRLWKQKDFRAAQDLSFCYACGQTFTAGEIRTNDHVPARACFARADRNHPLILPTHEGCNSGNNLVDEKIGQLIGLRRGTAPEPSKRRLRMRVMNSPDGGTMGGVNNLDIPGAVKRWISAFHAALYAEPLSPEVAFAMETPFPMATIEDGKVIFRALREEQHRNFVEVLKRQRAADNFDGIRCNNGKLTYECVWDQFDEGKGWLCIFGLDLYGWADLGDTQHFPRRGCVGSYVPPQARAPDSAARATRYLVQVPNSDPLDPFGA